MREVFLNLASPPYSAQQYVDRLEAAASWAWNQVQATSKASASEEERCKAQQLCSLLLIDPEMLDVLLALHDIRAAQLWQSCYPTSARQGRTLKAFVLCHLPATMPYCLVASILAVQVWPDHVSCHVWPSFCHITDIILAVLQSNPSQAQPPGPAHALPAATTTAAQSNSSCQLPPGFVRCSAGLNLSLRLATGQAVQARQQVSAHLAAMDRLHPVLGPWLRGQCMAHSLLLAASHPQWEAQRAEAVCNLLTLVEALSRDVELGDYTGKDISPVFILAKQHAGQPQLWLHNLLASPMTTGWPGPLPAARAKYTAQPSAQHAGGGNSSRQGSGSTGAQLDLRVVNSYAHICHALSSLVLQQPQPLERMKLFSTTSPAAKEPKLTCFIRALDVGSALLAREASSLQRLVPCHSAQQPKPLNSLSNASSVEKAIKGMDCACSFWQSLSPQQDCLDVRLPFMLPLIHRAVTVTSGSAVLLRLTLWATLHQPLDTTLATSVLAFTDQFIILVFVLASLLSTLQSLDSAAGCALLRLSVQAAGAAAHANTTLMQITHHGAMGAYGPGIAWPQHPIHAWAGADALFQWNMLPAAFTKLYIPLQKWAWPGAANRLAAAGTLDVLTTTELFLQVRYTACCGAELISLLAVDLAPVHLVALSTQLLQDPAVVGPAGLAAKPAAWLPPGQQLVKGWCTRLANRVCQMADRAGLVDVPHCGFVMSSEMHVLSALVDHVPMQPAAERALALLLVTLGFAMPLITVLKLVGEDDIRPDSQLAAALEELRVLLSQVPAHQVQGWLEAVDGTCGEAILNHALVAAALKLQLPHLTAPATKESTTLSCRFRKVSNATRTNGAIKFESQLGSSRRRVEMQGIARDILTQQASQLEGDPLAFLNVTEAYWKTLKASKHEPNRKGPTVVRVAQPGARLEHVDFDVVVCGGTLGLMLAATLQRRGHKVAVVDKRLIQGRTQEWNISRGELAALTRAGLLTAEELSSCIASEFNPVRVGFAGGEPIWVNDCLNLGVSPRKLLDLVKEKFVEAGGVLMENVSFKSAEVMPGSGVRLTLNVHAVGQSSAPLSLADVNRPNGLGANSSNNLAPFTPPDSLSSASTSSLDISPASSSNGNGNGSAAAGGDVSNGKVYSATASMSSMDGGEYETLEGLGLRPGRKLLRCRLLMDCMGHYSDIVKQMRGRSKPDGMCLVVGSCAEGFPTQNNSFGDLLYTIDNARDDIQMFWEAFPAEGGAARTTYMFAYSDAEPQRPSFEALLDRYFEGLHAYQGISAHDLRFKRVLFGGFPCWNNGPLQPQWDHIIQVGDASATQSPLSFGGFGAMLRHLTRLTEGLDDALRCGALSRSELACLHPYQPSLAASWLFQRSMSVGVGQLALPRPGSLPNSLTPGAAPALPAHSSSTATARSSNPAMPQPAPPSSSNGSSSSSSGVAVAGAAGAQPTRLSRTESRAPAPQPWFQFPSDHVNQVLACNFGVMKVLGDKVLRPFLQDTIQFLPLTLSMTGMMFANPLAISRVLLQVGPNTLGGWFVHYLALFTYTAMHWLLTPLRKAVREAAGVERNVLPAGTRPPLSGVPLTSSKGRSRSSFWLRRLFDTWEYGSGLDHEYHPSELPPQPPPVTSFDQARQAVSAAGAPQPVLAAVGGKLAEAGASDPTAAPPTAPGYAKSRSVGGGSSSSGNGSSSNGSRGGSVSAGWPANSNPGGQQQVAGPMVTAAASTSSMMGAAAHPNRQ
ncbi:hypothetical protein QJQ45_021660 [Haematococcus lacustris]|nr:hypothetical protein QJQ45_021660 [Haematococcus lacustris]